MMNCINNIFRTPVPNDVFMLSLKLYYQMGKNDYYESLFSRDKQTFLDKNILNEAYSFYKCFFSGLKIPESRLRTLTLDSTVAKNRQEQLYKNILEIFKTIHQNEASSFHLNVTEIYDLVRLLFKDYYPVDKLGYRKIERTKHSLIASEITSKREQLEELINRTLEIKKQKQIENFFLYLNFTVDFIHMDLFKFDEQEIVGILIFYILAIDEGMIATKYSSFFEHLLLHIDEYHQVLDKTRFGWSEGFSEMMPLSRFILKEFSLLYRNVGDKARDYEYETNLEISKSDYIENTIDKLPEVFSKEDVRLRHPLISDSTINRTLKRLAEENKIRPLGKGRSAKWVKLYKKEKKVGVQEQLNFDLED